MITPVEPIRNAEDPSRVLITGGSGFLGTNAVAWYLRRGCEVLNLDIKAPEEPSHVAQWLACDILDRRSIRAAVRGFDPEVVLHLAARTDLREKRKLEGYAVNMEGTANTIEALLSCKNLRRSLFASSRMVCRIGYTPQNEEDYCPPNLYGESKVRMEQVVRSAGLDTEWLIARPTSIWGPWFGVPYRGFFGAIARGIYYHPGTRNPEKSFGFVGNTMHQFGRLLTAPAKAVCGKTIYVCDYPPLRLREWAETIRRAVDARPIRSMPLWALRVVAYAGDILEGCGWTRPPLTSFRLNNLMTEMVFDTRSLKDLCGALPYSLEEGVKATVAWMTAVGDV